MNNSTEDDEKQILFHMKREYFIILIFCLLSNSFKFSKIILENWAVRIHLEWIPELPEALAY